MANKKETKKNIMSKKATKNEGTKKIAPQTETKSKKVEKAPTDYTRKNTASKGKHSSENQKNNNKKTTVKVKKVADEVAITENGEKIEKKAEVVIKEETRHVKKEHGVSSKKTSEKASSNLSKVTKNEKVASSAPVNSDEMMRLIKIILVVVVIAAIFYIITIFVTKNKKTKVDNNYKDNTPAIIQYDEIILGTLLNQNRDEYYVFIQKEDDQYNSFYSVYLKYYSSKSNALKVYIANMDSVFNQYYIAETSNLRVGNAADLRVSDVTLIKVKNKEVVEAYEGLESIENAFKELIK